MPEAFELIADGVRAERAGALDRALEDFRAVPGATIDPDMRAEALTHEADVLRTRCDWEAALAAARKAHEMAQRAELPYRMVEARVAEANVLMARGDFDAARSIFEQIAKTSSDPRVRGIALQNLGSIHAQCGKPRAAERAFSESLGNFHKAGYARGEVMALNNLGRLAFNSKDCERARPLLERALKLARDLEDSDMAAVASLNLAWVLCNDGDLDRSQDLAMSALGYFAGCNNRFREIECFRLIGEINERCEDMANAQRCYGLALSFAEQIGSEPEIKASQERLSALSRHVQNRQSK